MSARLTARSTGNNAPACGKRRLKFLFAVVAPAGTPAAIVERLHKEIGVGQKLPVIRKQFDTDGAAVMQISLAQFGSYMVADVEKVGQVVQGAGIKAR